MKLPFAEQRSILLPASRGSSASPLGFSEAKRAGQAGLKPPLAD